MKYFGLRQNVK